MITTPFDLHAPSNIDARYGKIVSGVQVPYASTAEALAALSAGFRCKGKTVLIDDGTGAKEYWFKDDTTTLVLKTTTIATNVVEFITGTTPNFTISSDRLTLTIPALIGKKVKHLFKEGYRIPFKTRAGSEYITYDITTGAIVVTNGTFPDDVEIAIEHEGDPITVGTPISGTFSIQFTTQFG